MLIIRQWPNLVIDNILFFPPPQLELAYSVAQVPHKITTIKEAPHVNINARMNINTSLSVMQVRIMKKNPLMVDNHRERHPTQDIEGNI